MRANQECQARKDLETCIKLMESQVIELGEKRKAADDDRQKDQIDIELLAHNKELRNLRRMRGVAA
jgi:hypothetical protein